MTRRSLVLITSAALLAGCGGKKDEAPPVAKGSATQPVPAGEESASELFKKPLKAISSRAGTLEFTIDLPDDASPPRIAADSATFDFKGSGLQISVIATATPIAADELAKKRTLADPAAEELLRADEISGKNYVITKARKDRTWFLFEHCRDVAYGNVCCAATMRTEKTDGTMDRMFVWVTDVCQHMSVAGESHSPPVNVDPNARRR